MFLKQLLNRVFHDSMTYQVWNPSQTIVLCKINICFQKRMFSISQQTAERKFVKFKY
jgi:hypothetical protein